jgi:hypothetical protein
MKPEPKPKPPATVIHGQCVCGDVQVEVDFPAFWAWHDHSRATGHAHGAAYATYIGSWKSRVRVIAADGAVTRFEHPETKSARSFCARCGTPLLYVRPHAPQWLNLPRALFATRVGREPRYHIGIDEAPDWEYDFAPLAPFKGYPGVLRERPRKRKLFPPV